MIAVFLHKLEKRRASWCDDAFVALLIFVAVALSYAVVLYSTFAVLDDWVFLYNSIANQVGTIPLLVGAGRPVNAILFDIGFSAAGSIEGLAVLRFVSLFGISILGFGLYLFSRAQSFEFVTSILIAVGVVLLPSFHVYASWAQHFTTPYAGALALFSAFILTPSSKIFGNSRVLAVLSSTLVLVLSLLIYQPLAMLFWTGILISLISGVDSKSRLDNGWTLAKIFDVFVAFSLAMIIAFVVFKIGQSQYPNDSPRYGLVNDLYRKVVWFVSEPLANSASLFVVPRSNLMQGVVGAIFIAGFMFLGIMHGTRVAARVIFITCCALFLSYVPNLATAENWASYRSTGVLAATLLVSLIMILRWPMKYVFGECRDNVLSRTFIGFPVVLGFVFLIAATQSSVYRNFVLPNVIELNNLAAFLKEQRSSSLNNPSIIVKASSWRDSNAQIRLYDEFGMHSSLGDHYAMVMVKMVVRSIGLFPGAGISVYSDIEKAGGEDVNAGGLMVDFSRLVTAGRFGSDMAEWSGVDLRGIYPANINDGNWRSGIWVNSESPSLFSFTYKRRYGDRALEIGDRLIFKSSGVRVVTKIEVGDEYANIAVDGGPLVPADGYPNSIRIAE